VERDGPLRTRVFRDPASGSDFIRGLLKIMLASSYCVGATIRNRPDTAKLVFCSQLGCERILESRI
jgi:hypothetical protein